MKRAGGIVGVGLLLLSFLHIYTPKALAITCNDAGAYGAVKLFLPELSTQKQYALWVRLQSATPATSVLIESGSGNCFQVDAQTPVSNQWFWQQYQLNGVAQLMMFTQEAGNTLEVIGIQAGVKVDKVLLTEPDCVPQDFGNNCSNSIEAVGLNQGSVTMLQPPSNGPVGGKISLSVTPTVLQDSLKELRYVVDGKTLQRSAFVDSFDTTMVENGKHTVYIETELLDGTLIRESTVIDVDNAETPLSPSLRWIRLHKEAITLTGMVAAAIIILLLLMKWFKLWVLKRRQLHYHGF